MANIQYVIKRGIVDNIDYNMDGAIDEHDDIVVKMVDGKEVGRRPLNEPVRNKIEQILEHDRRLSMRGENANMQRVYYERAPPSNMENPPPVVIKQDSGFAEYFKMGAGNAAGQVAVYGIVGILGSLFSGGGSKRRSKQPPRK